MDRGRAPAPSSCTACPPTGARRSPPRWSTARAAGSGPRPRTACTRPAGLLAWLLEAPMASQSVRCGKPQRQHLIAKLIEQHAVSNQAQLVELLAAEGCIATQATVSRDLEDLGAIKVRVAGRRERLRHPRAAHPAGRPRGPPAPGVRRLGGRGGPLRQPGRAAHPARLGPRGGLGPRPGRPARHRRHGRRRRHAYRGRRRGGRRRRAWPTTSPAWPGSSVRPASQPSVVPRLARPGVTHAEPSRPRLQRRSGHLRRRAVDDRGAGGRGHHRGRRPRPGRRLGGAAGPGPGRRAPSTPWWSTAARSSPATSWARP